jgi:hypothetical protein
LTCTAIDGALPLDDFVGIEFRPMTDRLIETMDVVELGPDLFVQVQAFAQQFLMQQLGVLEPVAHAQHQHADDAGDDRRERCDSELCVFKPVLIDRHVLPLAGSARSNFRKSGIRFSIRKCDPRKVLEQFLLPQELKLL